MTITKGEKIITYSQAIDIAKELTIPEMVELIRTHKKDVLIRAKRNVEINPHFLEAPVSKLYDKTVDYQSGTKAKRVGMICPFHETPNKDSTFISSTGRSAMCYVGGCEAKKSLSSIDFYVVAVFDAKAETKEKSEGIWKSFFGKAVREICGLLGYTVKDNKFPVKPKRLTEEEKLAIKVKEILQRATDIYHQAFLANDVAQNYFFKERGFEHAFYDENKEKENEKRNAFVSKYKVGFAPEEFPSSFLLDQLEGDYTIEELLASGLIWKSDKEKKYYINDFLSNSLILPYWNEKFESVRHYGRFIPKEETPPLDNEKKGKDWKHMRVSGDAVFLLNFHQAKNYKEINLVEGEFSLMAMLAMDFENTMASYGTNGLKDEHVQMLVDAREKSGNIYLEKVNLIYDGDGPGRAAVETAGEKLIKAGFEVNVTLLEDNLDPNDYLKKYKRNGKSLLSKAMAESVSYFAFIVMNNIPKNFEKTTERIKAFEEIKEKVTELNITEDVQLYLIAQEFAKKAGVPFELVWDTWERKENINVELFSTSPYLYLTKNKESFYIMNFTNQKTAYIEDTKFRFLLKKNLTIKSIIVETKDFTKEEIENIQQFINNFQLKFLFVDDFKEFVKSETKPELLMLFKQNNNL